MVEETEGKRKEKEEGWEIVFVSLCVHYGMPSILPSARGWRHGNSCSSVTAETREMLDIKKITYSYKVPCVYFYTVCACVNVCVCCSILMRTNICRWKKQQQHSDSFFSARLFLCIILTPKFSVIFTATEDVQVPHWFPTSASTSHFKTEALNQKIISTWINLQISWLSWHSVLFTSCSICLQPLTLWTTRSFCLHSLKWVSHSHLKFCLSGQTFKLSWHGQVSSSYCLYWSASGLCSWLS